MTYLGEDLPASLDADDLGHRDLHMIDAGHEFHSGSNSPLAKAKPPWMFWTVSAAARKWFDAEDLILTQRAPDLGVQYARADARSVAEAGFSITHERQQRPADPCPLPGP